MNHLKKISALVAVLFFFAVSIAVYIHFSLKTNTVRVAFYGIPKDTAAAFSSWLDGRNVGWTSTFLNANKPLKELITKPTQYDMLFIYDGCNMDSIAPFVRNAETAALQILPPVIRIAVQTNGRLVGTPILIDPFQVFCSKAALDEHKTTDPVSLAQLERLAQKKPDKRKKAAPFLCAGKNDEHLIMFFSSLLEACAGSAEWEKAASMLSSCVPANSAALKPDDFTAFFELKSVRSALERIMYWQQNGFLSEKWLNLSVNEALEAMEKNAPAVVFAPLSFYRSLSEQGEQKYTPWYMPSDKAGAKRFFTAQTIAALQFSVLKSPLQSAAQANNKGSAVRAVIREMVSSPAQTKLFAQTALVPVNSGAKSDFAAERAQRILSSSDGIVPDIARAALCAQSARSSFAQALRKALAAN